MPANHLFMASIYEGPWRVRQGIRSKDWTVLEETERSRLRSAGLPRRAAEGWRGNPVPHRFKSCPHHAECHHSTGGKLAKCTKYTRIHQGPRCQWAPPVYAVVFVSVSLASLGPCAPKNMAVLIVWTVESG